MPRNVLLPEEYRAEYGELLRAVAEQRHNKTDTLCAFFPLCGDDYMTSVRLMIVGRAVNGWEDGLKGWAAAQMEHGAGRSRLIRSLVSRIENSVGCPMSWVVKKEGDLEYNTRRSAFWRVARRTHNATTRVCENWSSHLCWTNLYKLAGYCGGNPGSWLRRCQLENCANLLRIELSSFRPSTVLVLAGSEWFQPFAERLSLDLMTASSCDLVQQVGSTDGVRWLVGKHPQGKPEDKFVDEIGRVLASRLSFSETRTA